MPEIKQKSGARTGFVLKVRKYFRTLGPGLVTGASDDDPSGIGTYSQTGAQFGYSQLWTALFTFPLTAVIQEICARIALHTGTGLADIIRKNYSKRVLYFCVILLFVANTINVGADLGAMAASGQLLVGLPYFAWLLVITVLNMVLPIFIEYNKYARVLKFLTLALFAYVLTFLLSPQKWAEVLRATFVPTLSSSPDYLLNIVAILGTTVSPYLFFWQASQEVEEEIRKGKKKLKERQGVSRRELKGMRTDVISGMFFSNLIMWFIIATTASILFTAGMTEIDSAPKAAEALRPLAGDAAYVFFSFGIIGTGMLSIPVLAGSAAYAVSEAFKMRQGLYLKLRQAPGFYGIIVLSTGIGFALDLAGINPMRALYYSAVLNGLVAPPLLLIIMLISGNTAIMKGKVNNGFSKVFGWVTTVAMAVAAVSLLVSLASGK